MSVVAANLWEFAGETLLAEGFEEDEGDAVREVERTGGGVEHWNAKPMVAVGLEKGAW